MAVSPHGIRLLLQELLRISNTSRMVHSVLVDRGPAHDSLCMAVVADVPAMETLLTQFPSDEMQAWAVSKDVGNVRNQGV